MPRPYTKPTKKRTLKLDIATPVQASVPKSVVLRLDYLVEQMQYSDPSVTRSRIVTRFLTEKLNENNVPMITPEPREPE